MGKLHPDLLLLGGWENVDDPVDGLGGPHRVQGGEDKLTGFGGGDDGADGFKIPHFAQQDHVRGLAKRGPQSGVITAGVVGNLPLADDAAVMGVQIFDGILQRDGRGRCGCDLCG